MVNTLNYLLGSVYSGIYPLLGAISGTYMSDGKLTPYSNDWLLVGGAFFLVFPIVMIALAIFMILTMWIIFEKAGRPGWAAIVPIYNFIILLEIIKKPTWWVILLFIPLVNIAVSLIITYYLALAFGKNIGFTIGLIFLPFIFCPVLAFGKSTYQLGKQSDFSANAPPQSMPPKESL